MLQLRSDAQAHTGDGGSEEAEKNKTGKADEPDFG